MIVRPTQPGTGTPSAAQRLAQQDSDFTAEGAPPPLPPPGPARVPKPVIAHGPAPRKRGPREQRR